jgi:diguanylate cyclase (GGDEF)-like protein/PAS domain S-box-containing protein
MTKDSTNGVPRTDEISFVSKLTKALVNPKMASFINMIDVIAEGIFIVNEEGIIQVINPIAAKFLGNSQINMLNQRWFHLLHDRYREQYEYLFLNWRDNVSLPLHHGPKEVLLRRADGSWLEADLSLSCLPTSLTDGKRLVAGVIHNLTKHKAEYRELRRQACTDHLTGLANRFNLEKTLNRSWNDSIVNQQPISLILIDVDHFKHFNDEFGHVNGDKCLQKIAKSIESCLPSDDCLAARYGGEEFAVILPNCHKQGAEIVARHIQQQVNILQFSELGLPANFRISVSQGYACEHQGQYRTPEALICAADTALYRAKTEGRNRINMSM